MSQFNLKCNDVYKILNASIPLVQNLVKTKLTPIITAETPAIKGYLKKQIGSIPFVSDKQIDKYLNSYIPKIPNVISEIIGNIMKNIDHNCQSSDLKKLCTKEELYDNLKPDILNGLGFKDGLVKNLISTALYLQKSKITDALGQVLSYKLYKDLTLSSACSYLLSTCQTSFCNKGAGDSTEALSVNCTEINNLINYLFTQKQFLDEFNKLIKSIPGVPDTFKASNITEICQQLKGLGNSKTLSDKINTYILKTLGKISDNTFDNVYKKYQDQLPLLIKCICPDIDNVIKPHKLVPVTKPPKYSFKRLSISGGVLLVLVIIILLVLKIFIRSNKFIPYFIIFSLIIIAIILWVLVIKNPACLFKSCAIESSSFNTIEKGIYTGSVSVLGMIKLSIKLNVQDINNIQVENLNCVGKICPFGNITEKCKDLSVILDLSSPTDLGLPVLGPCIDEVKQIKTSDKTSVIRGLWLSYHNKNYYINIQIHTSGTITLNEVLSIKLNKNN
jgi:hypothetical protein